LSDRGACAAADRASDDCPGLAAALRGYCSAGRATDSAADDRAALRILVHRLPDRGAGSTAHPTADSGFDVTRQNVDGAKAQPESPSQDYSFEARIEFHRDLLTPESLTL
jgi:hypothetical protein